MFAASAAFASIAAAFVASRRIFGRAAISGDSMLPAFEPGDRVLYGPAWFVRPGQIVVLADPRQRSRLIIKRVLSARGTMVDVRGDNPDSSTDGRHFGLVPRSLVAGRVIYRYAPRGRAGWWPQ